MKGVSELIDAFDAELAIQILPTLELAITAREAVKERAKLGFASWHRWPGDEHLRTSRFTVVLPETGVHASREFSAGGKWLVAQLQKIGQWSDDYGLVSSSAELGPNGRGRALRHLDLSGSRYVLLLGTAACNWYRTDLPIRDMAGRLHLWDNRWFVWCMEAPQSVMRARANGTSIDAEYREQLLRFVEIVEAGTTPLNVLASQCVKHGCTEAVWFYDRDAIGWCRGHQKAGEKGRVNTRKYWHAEIDGQGTLGVKG